MRTNHESSRPISYLQCFKAMKFLSDEKNDLIPIKWMESMYELPEAKQNNKEKPFSATIH